MCEEVLTPKPCPAWCAGGHDEVDPGEAFLHASRPQILALGGATLDVRIESLVENSAQDPPPGLITWDCGGAAAPAMTTWDARLFAAVIAGLIDLLEHAERTR